MKSKPIITVTNTNYKSIVATTYKNGKPLKEFVPPVFKETRIMNVLFNNENFTVKNKKENLNFFKPNEPFPEWPSDEEIEVRLFI